MKLIAIATTIFIVFSLLLFIILPSISVHADSTEYYAIIVGIANYLYQDDLSYSVLDTTALYETLAPIWGTSHIVFITDYSATKSAIHNSIQNWLAPLEDSDDVVLFYFDGHGGTDGSNYYIAPTDSSLYSWDNDIADFELNNWLSILDSNNVVVILDNCESGGFVTDLSSISQVIMTSSTSSEGSYSSMFTDYLVQALDNAGIADNNGDYTLTTQELFTYTSPRTTQFVADNWGESQHPVYYGSTLPLFLIATISTNVAYSTLTIEGTQYAIDTLPISILLTPSQTHQATAQSEINSGTNTRYGFSSWNDGVATPTRTINQGGQYTANYKTQYYFYVYSTDVETIEGSGWYDVGATAGTGIAEETITEGDTRYVFQHWKLDGVTVEGDYITTSMNSPHTACADYKTQHYLSVSADHGMVEGTGWYDYGAVVSTGTAQGTITEGDTRYVFQQWDIDNVSKTGNPVTIYMYHPQTAVADYKTQYYLDIQSKYGTIYGEGWYDSEAVVQVSAPSIVGTLIRHKFDGWSGSSYDDNTTASIYMDQPKSVVATWKTDYIYLYLLIAGAVGVALATTVPVSVHIRNDKRRRRAAKKRKLQRRKITNSY